MYAYPPVYQSAWPSTPTWHPPAEMLEVVYPSPGPYARRKDVRMGSLAMMPWGSTWPPRPLRPVKKKKRIPKERRQAGGKPIGKQISDFFKKDKSGKSKAGKVAERAFELVSKEQAASPRPRPRPIVIQAPAAPAAPAGVSPIQLALVGLVAVGVGVGVGYAFGRTR